MRRGPCVLLALGHFLQPSCFNLLPREMVFQTHPSLGQFSPYETGEGRLSLSDSEVIPHSRTKTLFAADGGLFCLPHFHSSLSSVFRDLFSSLGLV